MKENCSDSIKKLPSYHTAPLVTLKIAFVVLSATGHDKGAVDGVGGLMKHYATSHNLLEPLEEAIQNANNLQYMIKNVLMELK